VLINPEFVKLSQEKDVGWEGCLSIPDTYALVERPTKIIIKAFDVNGTQFKLKADGFLARVIQHEMDHLDGKIILDDDRQIGNTLNQKEFDKLMEKKSTL
jgi:peptide deformylase